MSRTWNLQTELSEKNIYVTVIIYLCTECQEGSLKYEGDGKVICYFVAKGLLGNFDTKKQDCAKTQAGATLAIIPSQGAQDFLKKQQ